MEDMEAGSGFWVFGFCVGRRHCTLRVPLPEGRPSCGCLCFGKQVYHAKPTLDLGDGFDLLAKSPSSFHVNQLGDASFITLMR
jgi:hypothetical protein